jgi:hypothetical protein
MASFIGGEALARVVNFRGSFFVPPGVGLVTGPTYTVPTGRYAEISVLATSISSENILVIYADTSLAPQGAIAIPPLLNEGDSFTLRGSSGFVGSTAQYAILIREYNKPDAITLP